MKRILFFIAFRITILSCLESQNYYKGVLNVLIKDKVTTQQQ